MNNGESGSTNLLLTFSTASAFLDSYREAGPMRGIFAPTRVELPPGDPVDLEIVFADELMVFHAHGTVLQRMIDPASGQQAGLRVDFLAAEERTRQVVLEYARGRNRQMIRRRPRRFPIHMEIDYATDQTFTPATTDDFSKNGAFLVTDELLDAGTLVALRIRPADGPPISCNGEVAWRQTEPRHGFGVRFLLGDPDRQRQVDELVERLSRKQGPAGNKP